MLKNTLGRDIIYLETEQQRECRIGCCKIFRSVARFRQKTKGFNVIVNIDGTKALPVILDTLRKDGIEISTIKSEKPTMDDVFVLLHRKRDPGRTPGKDG